MLNEQLARDFLPEPPGSVTGWCPQRLSECPREEGYLKKYYKQGELTQLNQNA